MDLERNIDTGVGATLAMVCRDVSAGAELAVVRGDVGIGKTVALARLAVELASEGTDVRLVTATEATAANVNAFLRGLLGSNFSEAGSGADAEAAVWSILSGRPFLTGGRRVLLIVDEAQKLASRVLETIRGLWDRGEAARLGDTFAPAFGCVLVGNPTFLSKGGAQRVAGFEPLISRLAYNITLPRPNKAECQSFALTVFPQRELADALSEGGALRGSLRVMEIAARSAVRLANGEEVTAAHVQKAFKMMGAK